VPIPVIDPKEFRLLVAGLIDPNRKPTGAAETESIRNLAVDLCLVMCELYSDKLDRVKLWDGITNALKVAAAKCDDGDCERFAAICLDKVQADHATAAANKRFANWITDMETRDDAFRQAFVRHCDLKASIVVVHARNQWEKVKMMKGGAS
jgi:hypothetical protein